MTTPPSDDRFVLPSVPVATPADALRQGRERRGLTLEQAAEGTRISAEYLEALERDAPMDAFPSPAYARLFLSSYARFLRLEEEPLLAVFRARQGPAPGSPPSPLPGTARLLPVGHPRRDEPVGIHPEIVTSARSPQIPLSADALRAKVRARRRTRGGIISRVPVDIRRDAGSARMRRHRRHAVEAAAAAAVSLAVVGAVLAFPVRSALTTVSPTIVAGRATPPHPLPLPRGGYTIFPAYRVVAFYGAPRTEALGVLGEGPEQAVPKLLAQAEAYGADGTPILPAMELVATVASNHPGPDGLYRNRQSAGVIEGYLAAAREARMLLVLDIQPGRASFFDEVRAFRRYLEQPDVGLAIDPEWHVGPTQVPAHAIGSVDAATVNRISAWLAEIVREGNLPQKLFVIHQFTVDMLRDKRAIMGRPELATVLDVDGFGGRENKVSKYVAFNRGYRRRFFHGIKLYYHQDQDLMPPGAVLKLSPVPNYVVYQ
jgi:transcriptional regulator with XRE-family HTH domain